MLTVFGDQRGLASEQLASRSNRELELGFKGLDGRRSTISVAAGSCGCSIGAFGGTQIGNPGVSGKENET